MSAGGKVAKLLKEKPAKVNSSQNGKPEAAPTNKNQPTAEQMRLAQIISDRTDGDPEIAAKVAQISDLTGRSSDEAMTALYDCDYDVNRTVEKLLENQEASADEWQVIDKKKKPPVMNKGSPSETPSDFKFENQTEPELELNHTGGAPRGRPGRGAPRLPRGRGRAAWSDRVERSRENTSRERETGFESSRGRRRANFGELRGRGGRRGARSMHSNKFETQIDTWTNESTPNGGNDSRIGSWTDVTDEWTADEWNGSLNESCVFTPSASSRSANVYSVPNDANVVGKSPSSVNQNTTMTFESSNRQDQGGLTGDTGVTVDEASFSSMHPQAKPSLPGQDSISQQYVAMEPPLSSVNEMANCYGNMSDRTMYVSHYNREATECIKSVMGIGRNSLGQNSPTMDEMGRPAGHQHPVSLQQSSSSHIQRVKQARPRLPPPSKIPSMPVEMPDSMNSSRLDVQFGSWDAVPAATGSNISFISDIIPSSDYIRTTMNSSSQASTVSSTSVTTQPAASSFDPNISESQLTLSESHVTPASKPTSFPSALAASNKANETLHNMMVSMSASSSGLLTSVTKASGSASSQLGFNQMAYSSSSSEGVSASGPKMVLQNGPNHYGSFSYHSGASSLGTMSADYNLSQEQVQYTYGDSQRYSSPQTQPEFSPTPLPPGYSSGPLPNQLHYNSSQGPAKLFVSEKQGTGVYSVGASDVTGLYADKQGAAFSATLSQSYDSNAVYPSVAGGFQSGNQSNGMSLSYPGVASGLNFQGMQMESSGFDAGQYPVYRQKEGPSGYDIAGTADGQRGSVTTGANFSGVQGQTNQSFSSNFGSGGNQVQASSSGSSFIGQSQSTPPTSNALGSQGLSTPSGGSYSGQRQSMSSAGSAYANHTPGSSQSFGSRVDGSQSTTAGLVSSTTPAGKLSDGVSKLNLKDGQQVESGTTATSVDGASNSAAGGAMTLSSAVAPTAAVVMTLASKTSLAAAAKSSVPQTSKPMPNIPPGIPSGAAAMLNHNYMIGQPPGFQLAAFGYPTAQQPLTYSSYEELQMLQQRFSNPVQYYDLALQTSAALAGRESAGPLGTQSYAGNDVKLAAMDVLSPVNAQPNQQQQAVTGNQQAFINHALHPAYSYYYPGATGILPYYPMVPMAIPSVSNPTLAGTTSTTQYQKPAVFGSHAYPMGMGAASGDLMAGTGNFGKTHFQTYERGGFHGGTPPPAFSMALPGGSQAAGALGAPTVYGPPYMPLVPHQQSHSQLLHHAVPQDSAVVGRPAPPSAVQQKMGGNKAYSAAYWGPN